MTKTQTIQLRLSECRQRLNELLGVETRSDEENTELDTLTAEVSKREPELRAAIASEPDPEIEGRRHCRRMVKHRELRWSCAQRRGYAGLLARSVRREVRSSEWRGCRVLCVRRHGVPDIRDICRWPSSRAGARSRREPSHLGQPWMGQYNPPFRMCSREVRRRFRSGS